MTERVALAQHRVGKALDAVGGIESLGGSLPWHMVGQGMLVLEWQILLAGKIAPRVKMKLAGF